MKSLWALLAWAVACPSHGALLPPRAVSRDATKPVAFLARKTLKRASGVQPWLYNPPPAVGPRSKPLEIPGDPLVLPPIDKMWGMQPSASPPTIEPPEKEGETGLQATIPPQSLEGWYATIPPKMIEDGLVDNRTAYYVRCLGGPYPCPYTVPPAVINYWARVDHGKTYSLEDVPAGATEMPVLARMGFSVGQLVVIDPLTPTMEVKTIKAFGSFIFDSPLAFAHKKGTVLEAQIATTPMPMPVMPWASFQPSLWMASPMPGPAPGPAPFSFSMPFLHSGPVPVPAPAPFLPMLVAPPAPAFAPAPAGSPGPAAPGPAGGAPGPGPAPAPAR